MIDSEEEPRPRFARVRIAQAWEQVADVLREEILAHDWAQVRLPAEVDLADQLMVSRGTLRRALRQLVREGLVESRKGAGGGTYVVASPRMPRPTSLDRLMAARRMLEVPAAGRASRATSTDRLERDFRHGSTTMGTARFTAHRAFHEELLRLAGTSPTLEAEPIFGWLGEHIDRERISPWQWGTVDADHARILLAVREGDEAAARHEMESHLARLRVIYSAAAC